MILYGKRKSNKNTATVCSDTIAFFVHEDEVDDMVEHILAAIIGRCLIDYGASPQILE